MAEKKSPIGRTQKDALPTKLWVVVTERGKSEGRWVAVTKHGTKYWYLGQLLPKDRYVPRRARILAVELSNGEARVEEWFTGNGSVTAYLSIEEWRERVFRQQNWDAVRNAFEKLRWAGPPANLSIEAMRGILTAFGAELPKREG